MQLTSKVKIDSITEEISKFFDYSFDGTTTFEVPRMIMQSDFGIGLIVGASGSGKSTLLRSYGEEEHIEWNPELSVASHFKSAEEAKDRLSGVGFNSIPSWLRPYHVLSTGEKFRADLAKRLKDNAVIDEFTSTVDRNVAKSTANSLRNFVDSNKIKNLVLSSCHYDIIEWLQPDWVYDTSIGGFIEQVHLRQKPTIRIEVHPAKPEAWSIFSKHHYLTGDLNKSARCWIATWDGVIVGFAAALSMPSGSLKNAWRGHRTVILPDFQGLGIGVRLSDSIGEIMLAGGYRYFSKSAHPRMCHYRNNSAKWKPTSKNGRLRTDYKAGNRVREKTGNKHHHKAEYVEFHADRLCCSHEYIGGYND
jgi:ABC-type lipoprotein export system ATPase subunit/GNAT superfamily N-acetyltransferase